MPVGLCISSPRSWQSILFPKGRDSSHVSLRTPLKLNAFKTELSHPVSPQTCLSSRALCLSGSPWFLPLFISYQVLLFLPPPESCFLKSPSLYCHSPSSGLTPASLKKWNCLPGFLASISFPYNPPSSQPPLSLSINSLPGLFFAFRISPSHSGPSIICPCQPPGLHSSLPSLQTYRASSQSLIRLCHPTSAPLVWNAESLLFIS